MGCRHRHPLEACGISFFAIAQKAFAKAQDLNGPLGSMMKKTARLAAGVSPLLCALQYQLLAVFAFADDYILAFETKAEMIFPPSKHMFDEIDNLIKTVETPPEKFDDALKTFPVIIQQVPLLDWVLVHIISWLNFLISVLTHWESRGTKEKEIVVDKGYSERKHDSEDRKKGSSIRAPKGTYKEVLEKGMKRKGEKKERVSKKGGGGGDTIVRNRDAILELFESGWLRKSPSKGTENKLSRSISYTN
ncbi:hypothetical protein SLA2020_049650 [Shorea laevis]